jgi:hypothetical protein
VHCVRRETSEFASIQASTLPCQSAHACSANCGTENMSPDVEHAALRDRTRIFKRLAWRGSAMEMNQLARRVNQATPTVKHGQERKSILESLT